MELVIKKPAGVRSIWGFRGTSHWLSRTGDNTVVRRKWRPYEISEEIQFQQKIQFSLNFTFFIYSVSLLLESIIIFIISLFLLFSLQISWVFPLFHLLILWKYIFFPLLEHDAFVFPGIQRLFLFLDEVLNSNCLRQVRLGLLDIGIFLYIFLALKVRQKLNVNLKPEEILWGWHWFVKRRFDTNAPKGGGI